MPMIGYDWFTEINPASFLCTLSNQPGWRHWWC